MRDAMLAISGAIAAINACFLVAALPDAWLAVCLILAVGGATAMALEVVSAACGASKRRRMVRRSKVIGKGGAL
jgi:VIT1/CCC1 family predicted Fe2+/Mn2+ transporter